MEPHTILAVSMVSMLGIGMLSQLLQSRGGTLARAAPVIVLGLIIVISLGVMVSLQGMLSAEDDWDVATPAYSMNGT